MGMSKLNAWANPSITSTADIIQMAAFLEERSRFPDMGAVNLKLCEVVAAVPGEHLLEAGSGSGVLCRMLVPYVQPKGEIVGIDVSYDMATIAYEYAYSVGITSDIKFATAEAKALPFSNASFDCAIAARLLLHVSNPPDVIHEMARIVKPGGRVVVMDWDFETIAVDHPDREQTRRILHWRNDHHGGNNWSGRQLWRYMHNAGLQNLLVYPCVIVAHGESDGLTQSLWRAAQVAFEGGAISESEKDDWVKELKNRIQDGIFFASIVYFIVKGTVVTEHGRAV
jgi:ubiquinone/menaquinone biosynthesis C-methylase UbiE